jgi:hypothetical protein
MIHKSKLHTLFTLALLVLAVLVNLASGAPVEKVISIAEARSLPLGTVVTIDGSVTVASGAFDVSGLSPGQTIEVTGFSGQFADHFEVDPRTQADIRVVP